MNPDSASIAIEQAEAKRLEQDRLVRRSTIVVVVLVAAGAAYVSYGHAFELIHGHGESRAAALVGSGTVDGLVYASGMVLLQAARYRRRAPWLAYFGLWLGIAATVGANVAHGWSHGVVGALVSAWPAVALNVSYHLLMKLVRTGAAHGIEPGAANPSANESDCPHGVALTAQEAAMNAWFHRTECLGEDYSQRQLAAALDITNRKKLAQWIKEARPTAGSGEDEQPDEPPAAAAAPSPNGSAPA